MNQQAVIEKASLLASLFQKYKDENADILAAYSQCRPLIDRAMAGEFTMATDERLPGNYFTTEFDLINYRDLYKAASDLNMYLEGWDSEDAFDENIRKIIKE